MNKIGGTPFILSYDVQADSFGKKLHNLKWTSKIALAAIAGDVRDRCDKPPSCIDRQALEHPATKAYAPRLAMAGLLAA